MLLSLFKKAKKNNFYLMASNQLKRGIIFEKIAIQAGDDEQILNYEWPIYD